MSLLGLDYGSGSEAEEDQGEPNLSECGAPSTSLPSAAPEPPTLPPAQQAKPQPQRMELQPSHSLITQETAPEVGPTRAHVGHSFPESEVPAPSKQGVWSSLPTPKTKRVVQLNLSINMAMLKAAEREEEEDAAAAAKKRKPNPGKSRLKDLLPAPKNGHAPLGGSRLALGSGEGGAIDLTTPSSSVGTSWQPAKGGHKQSTRADSDDEDPMVRHGAMPEVGDFTSGPAADEDEVGPPASIGSFAAAWQLPEQQQQQQQQQCEYRQYGQQYEGVEQGPVPEHYEAGAYYVGAQPEYAGYADPAAAEQQGYTVAGLPSQLAPSADNDPGQALFAQALMEEQERASKKGKGIDLSGIQFKEVNQKDLTYVDPAAREAAGNVRSALGPEFAAKLRSEAKPFEGDRLSKRKHQIGTLFYNAKMRELEFLEGKASGMSQKKETAAKYGW